ncbi:hypothetical protein EB796_006034 [Bugula neritina]|uniref:Uncharacterized protein n=1 Tax=Bugula neritina TaxID=10212 RepID=A0A7J7KAH1_BUGNE|nr:hypothetical protein EB796_006034 [Bugula neritina]
MSYKIIHWKGSDMILSTHLVSSGGLLLLSIISLTQGGNLCSECDGQVNPFFTSLASPLLPDESSLQVGERTCTAARRVLGCYFDCELADGSVFEKVSYLYSPAVSTEANTINEWWRVNCEDGCRMADTLSCEHLTYNTTSDCSNIAQSCVDEALADYTCDGFCQVSDRWNKAYRLHHEIDCADASSVCLEEVKTCLKDVLSHRNSIGSSISYVMAWEFFYNGAGLSKEFRCQLYSEAEDCFTVYKSAGSSCHRESDLERLRLMMSTAYNDYCNSTVDIEDICFGQDFTSSTTTTSTTSSTSTTTTTTTPSTTSTFADTTTTSSQGQVATLVEVTSARGTCEYCDESATYHMQIASLHEHPNFNLKEFGDIGCRNYTAAANCYKNCSVAGRPSSNYTSPIYRALQSQLVLTCDPTCRHLDLWLCESYLTTSDWCKEGEYERWLTCYEDGAADYLCNGACNLAQRRVNTYKLAREVVCTVSREVESRECISAVNQCLNIKYSKTDMNFENFLTADISSENSCEYFVAGSDCLGGLTNEFENNKTINDLCTTQREREAIRKIGENWRSMYHHDDCVSQIDGKRRGQDSGTSYQSICEASDFNGTADATCDMLNVLEPGAECVLYSADKSCANPCRNLNPFNCAQREEWGECTSMHAADTSCNGLCSETERANAITTLTSSIHCNVPGQQPDFCMEAIQWSCMSELWVSSQDFVFDLFTQPKESLQSWCGKVEQMKHCFYNATYHQVPYFNRELTRPCASYADYMRSLIQLTSNLTTSTCQSPASTWQQTCPGSDIVIDTPKISQADACPDDIVSIETCSVLQPHLCGNNFDRWTDCLAEEGVFSQCPSLCSANRRRAFATYVEGFIVCHMDRTSEDFCWEYVANECLFGDRTFTKIINVDTEGTVTEMCQMMNNFRKCLADGKSENVTTVDLQIRSPCARQSQ